MSDDSDLDFDLDESSLEEGQSAAVVISANVSATHSKLQMSSHQSVIEADLIEGFSDDDESNPTPIVPTPLQQHNSEVIMSITTDTHKEKSSPVQNSVRVEIPERPTQTQGISSGITSISVSKVQTKSHKNPATVYKAARVPIKKPPVPRGKSGKQQVKIQGSLSDIFGAQKKLDINEIPSIDPAEGTNSKFDINTILKPPKKPAFSQNTTPNSKKPLVPTNFLERNKQSITKFKKRVQTSKVQPPPKKAATPKSNLNVESRFYDYKRKVTEKVQKIAADREKVEMEQCSFQPKINTQGRRTVSEFLYDVNNFLKNKEEKLNNIRNEDFVQSEGSKPKFQPTINAKSVRIIKKQQRNTPIHEKLFQYHRSRKQKEIEKVINQDSVQSIAANQPGNYVPRVNERSRSIKRSQSIDQILYEDAQRRRSQSALRSQQQPTQQKLINSTSERVLCDKFLQNFYTSWSSLSPKTDLLPISLTKILLANLQFLKDDTDEEHTLFSKMLNLISVDSQNTSKANILTFLRAVLNFYTPNMALTAFDSKNFRFGQLIEGQYSVTQAQCRNVFHAFALFRENYNKGRQRKVEAEAEGQVCTFTPRISKHSRDLSAKRSLNDSLMSDRSVFYLKNAVAREEKEEQEVSMCTFKPQIKVKVPRQVKQNLPQSSNKISSDYIRMVNASPNRTHALYAFSKVMRHKKELSVKEAGEVELEKNLDECSFTPNIQHSQSSRQLSQQPSRQDIKGVDGILLRLRKAREENARIRKIKDIRNDYEGDRKQMTFELGTSRSSTSLNSSMSSASTFGNNVYPKKRVFDTERSPEVPQDEEILILSVNLTPSITDNLEIRPNDDIESVVRAFVQKHDIEEFHQENLIKELTSTILTMDTQET